MTVLEGPPSAAKSLRRYIPRIRSRCDEPFRKLQQSVLQAKATLETADGLTRVAGVQADVPSLGGIEACIEGAVKGVQISASGASTTTVSLRFEAEAEVDGAGPSSGEGSALTVAPAATDTSTGTRLRCSSDRHLVIVDDRPDNGGLRYRSWKQPTTGKGSPSLELTGGAELSGGSPPCAHLYFRFVNGEYSYTVGGVGCSDNARLFEAKNALRVWKGDDLLSEVPCAP